MSKTQFIRAWKSEEFRNSLTPDQRAQIPEHPAGLIELTCAELMSVDGSAGTVLTTGIPCEIDSFKFTNGGFCARTNEINCDGSNSGLTAIKLR